MKHAAVGLGALRLAVAAAILFLASYVLSWQILYSGPVGNDTLFQLHLARWVDSSFPALHWWYPWDDHGIGYREGYPLAAHWVTAAVSRLGSLDLSQAMQVVQFVITPLGALGVYLFCAWRLHRPLAGLVAGIAYLLSPLTWTFLVDWGFYTNQAGTALFMPSIIALDVFFEEWNARRRGLRFRLAAVSTMGLVTLMALVSPFLLGAAVAGTFGYVLAITGGGFRSRLRWFFVAAPALLVGTFLLSAFWSLPEQAYLSFIATHVPPRGFDPGLFTVWGLDQLFGTHSIRPTVVLDRASVSPAVWIPAVAGGIAALWNSRARVFVGLVAFGVLTMVTTALEAATWGVPLLGNLVHERAGVTLVQFGIPLLAGLGLAETPIFIGAAIGDLARWGARPRFFASAVLVCLALAAATAGVGRFAHSVDGSPTALAYGDFQPSTSDLWARYPPGAAPNQDVVNQLANPSAWRPPQVGCYVGSCVTGSGLASYQTLFSSPPQRAVLDAHVPRLLMALPDLTGGGQAYTYNFQLPTSPELDNWMLDSMLNRRGTVVKAELSAALGIDAVVLGSTQTGQAEDYRALGWNQVSDSPLTFVNPSPSTLATEWPSAATALVIGSDQRSASHPYNDLFERATAGMIPFSWGWLVRGQSAYVDDYSAAQLASYPMLALVGYRYHDRGKAFALLDDYVRAGGSLYIETGWQYVDPDWNLGSPTPSVLPVGQLRWGALDPNAPVVVSGADSPSWGSLAYGTTGWGASSASMSSVRQGAEALVSVGGRVVVAREQLGRGRVFWSGMNLVAHSAGSGSAVEDQFTAGAFAWLMRAGEGAPQSDAAVTWVSDDEARLALSTSSTVTWVLFKESFAPGWSAELRWPGSPGVGAGSRTVRVLDGEADFMLVRLDSVPPGAQLLFRYGPTNFVYLSWALSGVSLLVMLVWLIRPRWFRRVLAPAGRRVIHARDVVTARYGWGEDEDV